MNTTTIKGYSDDIISVNGDWADEFNHPDAKEMMFLGLSDGTCLGVTYDGCWRINPIVVGIDTDYSIVQAVSEDDDNYSDVVTLETKTPVRWAVYGQ